MIKNMTYTEIVRLFKQVDDLEKNVLFLLENEFASPSEKYVIIDRMQSTLNFYQNMLRKYGLSKYEV